MPKNSSAPSKNPKESQRITKNLKESQRISKNPKESQRIPKNPKESQRPLRPPWREAGGRPPWREAPEAALAEAPGGRLAPEAALARPRGLVNYSPTSTPRNLGDRGPWRNPLSPSAPLRLRRWLRVKVSGQGPPKLSPAAEPQRSFRVCLGFVLFV